MREKYTLAGSAARLAGTEVERAGGGPDFARLAINIPTTSELVGAKRRIRGRRPGAQPLRPFPVAPCISPTCRASYRHELIPIDRRRGGPGNGRVREAAVLDLVGRPSDQPGDHRRQ